MSRFARTITRRPPTLFLLGMLALLLWGQCGLTLNDNGRYVPTVRVRVVRDSLASATKGQPAQLYLTLAFTNRLGRACRLDTIRGNVSFKKQYWNFVAAQAHDLELPPEDNLRPQVLLPVVIPLIPSADSLAAFRKALRTGSRADNSLRVYLRATYAIVSEPDRQWPVEATTYLPAQPPR